MKREGVEGWIPEKSTSGHWQCAKIVEADEYCSTPYVRKHVRVSVPDDAGMKQVLQEMWRMYRRKELE